MYLKHALQGNLASWRGLRATETIKSLAIQLQPLMRVNEPQESHRTYRRCLRTVFERSVAPTVVEGWVVYGKKEVAIIEYDDPPVVALEETLQAFGRPEMVLSDHRFAVGALVHEYVYSHHGITFSVAEPFETAGSKERRLVHLQLFPPTTLELYLTDLGVAAGVSPKTNHWPLPVEDLTARSD